MIYRKLSQNKLNVHQGTIYSVSFKRKAPDMMSTILSLFLSDFSFDVFLSKKEISLKMCLAHAKCSVFLPRYPKPLPVLNFSESLIFQPKWNPLGWKSAATLMGRKYPHHFPSCKSNAQPPLLRSVPSPKQHR